MRAGGEGGGHRLEKAEKGEGEGGKEVGKGRKGGGGVGFFGELGGGGVINAFVPSTNFFHCLLFPTVLYILLYIYISD